MTALPVPPFRDGAQAITAETVRADRSARPFLRLVDRHPAALTVLLAVLNRPEVEREMVRRASIHEPALAAAVHDLEAEPRLAAVLDDPDDGLQLRRLIGVVVKLKMIEMGWVPRSMRRYTERFGTAETYEPAEEEETFPRGSPLAVLAALEQLKQIGTMEERARDVDELMAALAETRAAEGRPF